MGASNWNQLESGRHWVAEPFYEPVRFKHGGLRSLRDCGEEVVLCIKCILVCVCVCVKVTEKLYPLSEAGINSTCPYCCECVS